LGDAQVLKERRRNSQNS
jgi:hypothetical protein